MVEFAPGTDVQSAGGTYYTAPAGTAVVATNSQVRQGMLESSNVNPITSVVELITAQREVETMRRVLTMFSTEMDKAAVQDLPRVS
jgi:flagellar basal body rod protein FlgG